MTDLLGLRGRRLAALCAGALLGCGTTQLHTGDEPDISGYAGSAANGGICLQASCGGSGAPRPNPGGPPMSSPPSTPPSVMPKPNPNPPPFGMPTPPPGMPQPMNPPVLQCTPQVALNTSCAACACSAANQCASAISICGFDCWALLGCILDRCNGAFSTSCIDTYCAPYAAATMTARYAGLCVSSCRSECDYDLQRYYTPPPDEPDAGL